MQGEEVERPASARDGSTILGRDLPLVTTPALPGDRRAEMSRCPVRRPGAGAGAKGSGRAVGQGRASRRIRPLPRRVDGNFAWREPSPRCRGRPPASPTVLQAAVAEIVDSYSRPADSYGGRREHGSTAVYSMMHTTINWRRTRGRPARGRRRSSRTRGRPARRGRCSSPRRGCPARGGK